MQYHVAANHGPPGARVVQEEDTPASPVQAKRLPSGHRREEDARRGPGVADRTDRGLPLHREHLHRLREVRPLRNPPLQVHGGTNLLPGSERIPVQRPIYLWVSKF